MVKSLVVPVDIEDDMFALALPVARHTTVATASVPAPKATKDLHDDDLFANVLAQASAASVSGDRVHPIDAARKHYKSLQEIKKQKLERKAARNTVVHATEVQIQAAAKARRKTVGGSLEATLKAVARKG